MSDFPGVQWQPISQLPVFERLIGGMLAETLEFHDTLAGAVGRPQALDDATLDRTQRQYRERAEYLDLTRSSSSAGERRASPRSRRSWWTASQSRFSGRVRW